MIILARVVYGFLFTTRQLVSDVRRTRKVTKTGFLLEEEMLVILCNSVVNNGWSSLITHRE